MRREAVRAVELRAQRAGQVQELPALLVPVALFASNSDSAACRSTANRVLLALFCAHYFNRAVVFPLRLRGGKPTPVAVFLLALFFCLVNGYLQGRFLTHFHAFDEAHVRSPAFLAGVALMVSGFCINYHSDHVLRTLRMAAALW